MLGATDGATEGATDGAGGTGVGDEVHAAKAVNRDSDSVMVAMARFISNLQDRVGQWYGRCGDPSILRAAADFVLNGGRA